MGLIQAALSSASSTLADQWKEYFYCEAIPSDTIAVKGIKRTSKGSSNHGSDNIISDGSIISVADGQCMIIVENGKVVDICAEPGEFKYDSSTEPSIFTGSLGQSIKDVFAQFGKRFTYGGQAAADQRVYYFNTKELTGNKYGTANPIPFAVIDQNTGRSLTIGLRCFGEYSIKVTDPILFYTNVSGNFSDTYKVNQIADQLKSELLTAMQPAFSKLSEAGIRYAFIPGHTVELADSLNELLSSKWKNKRGIEIDEFGVSSITASEEDEQRLKQFEDSAYYSDASLAAGLSAQATAQAMKDAANNTNGAAMGFYGMNMAQQTGTNTTASLFAMGQQQAAAQQAAPAAGGWTCPACGTTNTGNFCTNCGGKKPEAGKWICPQCGTSNEGNFCTNCGTKKA